MPPVVVPMEEESVDGDEDASGVSGGEEEDAAASGGVDAVEDDSAGEGGSGDVGGVAATEGGAAEGTVGPMCRICYVRPPRSLWTP